MNNVIIPKIQHYVPQFILRNFTSNKKKQIYVYDKCKEKEFRTNIINIAAESGFYDLDFMESKLTIELSLSEMEAKASELIKKIIQEKSLSHLTNGDKKHLSLFFAIQRTRGTSQRTMILEMNKLLEKHIIKMGLNPSEVKDFKKMDEKDVKELSIKLVIDAEEQAPYYYDKAWMLFSTDKKNPFIISDNPIVLQNQNDFKPYGNLGLAVKGIEIYMPICDTLLLGFLCHSIEDMFREMQQKYNAYKNIIPNLNKELGVESYYYDSVLDSIDNGVPFHYSKDHVENVNSLQVKFSNRFIYSSDGNFELVKDMLKFDPSLKNPKYIMGN